MQILRVPMVALALGFMLPAAGLADGSLVSRNRLRHKGFLKGRLYRR